jgi:hypothetical protein
MRLPFAVMHLRLSLRAISRQQEWMNLAWVTECRCEE